MTSLSFFLQYVNSSSMVLTPLLHYWPKLFAAFYCNLHRFLIYKRTALAKIHSFDCLNIAFLLDHAHGDFSP